MAVLTRALHWVIALVIAVAIGSWSLGGSAGVAAQGSATPDAMESPLAACDDPDVVAETVAFANAETSTFEIQGVVLGNRPCGVIFFNESGNGPCP